MDPKVQKIAIFVNASPQRMEAFLRFQERFKLRLKLLQDVKTRWNSTLFMLLRFLRLKEPIMAWLEDATLMTIQDLIIEEEEWIQIRYVVQLTKPFALFGLTIGYCSPTIHKVF